MPSPAVLPALLDKVDVFELVRDQVAAILLTETINQQALALAATPPRDPRQWRYRVFSERTNPWGEFQDLPDDVESPALDILPIVNVWFAGLTFDRSASNVVERQKGTSTINVDVYTYGTSRATAEGHQSGDERAMRELHRVVRLVRNTLMAAQNTFLQMRGVVWTRWISGVEIFEPPADARAAQRIGAARLSLTVDHSEFSPQVQTVPLDIVSFSVRRDTETAELFFTADFPLTE